MNQTSCNDCKLKFKIEMLDYSDGECAHYYPEGFICMALEHEGIATWMVGMDENGSECDMFVSKIIN